MNVTRPTPGFLQLNTSSERRKAATSELSFTVVPRPLFGIELSISDAAKNESAFQEKMAFIAKKLGIYMNRKTLERINEKLRRKTMEEGEQTNLRNLFKAILSGPPDGRHPGGRFGLCYDSASLTGYLLDRYLPRLDIEARSVDLDQLLEGLTGYADMTASHRGAIIRSPQGKYYLSDLTLEQFVTPSGNLIGVHYDYVNRPQPRIDFFKPIDELPVVTELLQNPMVELTPEKLAQYLTLFALPELSHDLYDKALSTLQKIGVEGAFSLAIPAHPEDNIDYPLETIGLPHKEVDESVPLPQITDIGLLPESEQKKDSAAT